MTITEIRQLLESPYNQKIWKEFLQNQFTNGKLYGDAHTILISDNTICKQCYSLGNYEVDEYTKVGIFEVQLTDKVNLTRNRVALRNLIKDITKQVAGAMVVFVQGDKWRFSYISKRKVKNKVTNQIEDKETAPKRYTYLFGKNEKALTAAIRFDKLIQKQRENIFQFLTLNDFEDAFSVEKLSKEFFNDYKKSYEDFVEYLTGKRFSKKGNKFDEQQVQHPNVQLISIFDNDEKQARDFVKRMMGRIVFLYFIQKKGWLAVEQGKKWGEGDHDYLYRLFKNSNNKDDFYSTDLVPLFFKSLNTPESENESNVLRFPYLNGGLFDDSHDKRFNNLRLPEDIFSNLFETFSNFNFTVYEDAPDEHTVAVDPEMLGHIFENLLEDNKDKGAFYTPKEIVHYMSKESIKVYLYNYLEQSIGKNEIAKTTIEKIIQQQDLNNDEKHFAEKYAFKIIDALEQLKVCDPAIGSGAFPMGILIEIFNIQIYLQELKGFQKGVSEADIKKHIIEESIYGVDIDAGAVDIARLRFWLCLVVDEETPQPLPNLDFKIICANTLLSSGYEAFVKLAEETQTPALLRLDGSIQLLQEIREKYFVEGVKSKKDNLKNEFYNFRDKIVEDFNSLRKSYNLGSFLDNINEWDPFEDNSCSWFDAWWMFGIKDGFDIVIGNPPFVQLQKNGGKLAKLYEKSGYKTFVRSGDIYSLFYEKGINLLKKNGVLTFITSNSWMRTEYGEKTRKMFYENNPLLILTFEGGQLFENAIVDSNILVIQKTNNHSKTFGLKITEIENSLYDTVETSKILLEHLNESEWFIGTLEEIQIKEIVEKIGLTLDQWDLNINRGITTGYNDAFFINDYTKEILINEDDNCMKIIKPLLRGRMLSKYYTSINDTNIIFTKKGINIDDYKPIKNHLSGYFEFLKPKIDKNDRTGRKPGNYKWFEIQDNTNYYTEFAKPKIFWIQLSDKNRFSYSEDEVFATNSCFVLTLKNEEISLKYLLSVLNSKLILFYFKMIGSSSGMGTLEWTGVGTQKIPIPKINNKETITKFEILIDYITYLLKYTDNQILTHTPNSRIANHFDELINMMVYELYFENHMKENGIDVLEYINPQSIAFINSDEKKIQVIKDFYLWYQKPENPVRQRMLLVETRSKDKIALINKSIQ